MSQVVLNCKMTMKIDLVTEIKGNNVLKRQNNSFGAQLFSDLNLVSSLMQFVVKLNTDSSPPSPS